MPATTKEPTIIARVRAWLVAYRGGAFTPSDVARVVGVLPRRVGKTLWELERAGLVERVPGSQKPVLGRYCFTEGQWRKV